MKILFVSPSFPIPPNDGGKIVINNTLRYLKLNEVDVDFICMSKVPVSRELISQIDNNLRTTVFYDKNISGILRLFRAFLTNNSYLISKFYSKKFYRLIKQKIKNGKYDIIHFEGLHIAFYALKLMSIPNLKIVIRFQNIESQIIKRFRNESNSILKKLFFSYEIKRIAELEKNCCSNIANLIFISPEDLNYSKTEYGKIVNPLISPVGIDLDYYNSIKPNIESNDLLFLGSMDWLPNEDAFLWFYNKVFLHLLKNYPDIKFYVVGKNPSKKVVNLQSSNLIVTGLVEDVRPYIEKCGIFIVPLRIGGGMRVKIIEVMASQRIIISTSIGAEGINYIAGKEIIIANNPVEFLDALQLLIKHPYKKREITASALKKVQGEYSMQKVISDLIAYYKELI